MNEKTFFELPVYRITQGMHSNLVEKELAKKQSNYKKISGAEPSHEVMNSLQQYAISQLGTWKYNEIVGFIRLYFLGNQVRGEYYSSEGKSTRKSRTKIYTYRTDKLAPEVAIWPAKNPTNIDIWSAVKAYVDRCPAEINKSRMIDTSILFKIGPHLDWKAIMLED